jgi:uncharacterized protein
MQRTPSRIGALALLLAATVLAGCGLSRGPAPTEHYVLGGGLFQPGAAATPEVGRLVVGVRRLQVAPYLQGTSMVVRHGADRVTHAEFHRWGEPLADGIGRAVAGYLAAGATVGRAEVAPWPIRTPHDYLVQLHVLRFEGVAPISEDPAVAAPGEAQVVVAWELLRPADGAVVARGRTDHREPGWRVGDHGHLAALLDRGVQALAADLTRGLGSIAR